MKFSQCNILENYYLKSTIYFIIPGKVFDKFAFKIIAYIAAVEIKQN